MMKKPVTTKASAEQVVKDIRRATRKLHPSEEKIRIVLSGLRGEESIAELCHKEGIAQSLYYVHWTSISRLPQYLRSRKYPEIGPRIPAVLARRRRFPARRTDLSYRFRSVGVRIAVTRIAVAPAGGRWRRELHARSGR